MRLLFSIGCIVAMITLSACAPKYLVVLVPDPDGKVGLVEVSNSAGATHLDTAYHFTTLKNQQLPPSSPAVMTAARMEELFPAFRTIQPQRPLHFLLHFETGNTQLLPESIQVIAEIITAVQARRSRHISVVGHADTMGDEHANVQLSLRRAEAVKEKLIQAGMAADTMTISSHGEANPIVKTADNVANAENRRVEVVVR